MSKDKIALWFPSGYDPNLPDTHPSNMDAYIRFHNEVAIIVDEKIKAREKVRKIEKLFMTSQRFLEQRNATDE